ncbi:MAG: LURP-one-related family protein [Clostridia bacterium]
MMKYFISQKFFTFTREDIDILDENGNFVYKIYGQRFWAGKKLRLLDKDGNTVFTLVRRLFRFLTTIDILDRNNEKIAKFKQKFHIGFGKRFYIKRGEDKFDVSGNWLGLDYNIVTTSKQNPVVVAVIDKRCLSFADRYQVEINDSSLVDLTLCSVLCVDMYNQHKSNTNN